MLLGVAKPPTERRPARSTSAASSCQRSASALTVFGLQQSAQWGWPTRPSACRSLPASCCSSCSRGSSCGQSRRSSTSRSSATGSFSRRQHRPRRGAGRLRAGVLLRQRVRADLAGAEGGQGQPVAAVLLRRLRGRRPDRRPHARPHRRPAAGRLRMCAGLRRADLWANRVTSLSVGQQVWFIVLTGAGMGLMLGQANTDALNHAPTDRLRRGDRDHPDRPQLRFEPRPGRARHDPDQRTSSRMSKPRCAARASRRPAHTRRRRRSRTSRTTPAAATSSRSRTSSRSPSPIRPRPSCTSWPASWGSPASSHCAPCPAHPGPTPNTKRTAHPK